MPAHPPQRISIDRLDLDLRGIDPALAEAAVKLFGPALEARLAGGARHQAPGAPMAHQLAHHLANHLAEQVAGQVASQVNNKPSTPTTEANHAARRTD